MLFRSTVGAIEAIVTEVPVETEGIEIEEDEISEIEARTEVQIGIDHDPTEIAIGEGDSKADGPNEMTEVLRVARTDLVEIENQEISDGSLMIGALVMISRMISILDTIGMTTISQS